MKSCGAAKPANSDAYGYLRGDKRRKRPPHLRYARTAGILPAMGIQINIRDVPEKVRDELAARAALQGKSMQEYLRAELQRLASRPTIDSWLVQVRNRKRATQTRITAKHILTNRNADRR